MRESEIYRTNDAYDIVQAEEMAASQLVTSLCLLFLLFDATVAHTPSKLLPAVIIIYHSASRSSSVSWSFICTSKTHYKSQEKRSNCCIH